MPAFSRCLHTCAFTVEASSASENSLSARDLHAWLYEQRHYTCAFMLQDLAVLVLPATDIFWEVELRRFLRMAFHVVGFCGRDIAVSSLPAADIIRYLSYEGILHIVLPSQAKEDWLRDAVLRRSRTSVNDSSQLPVEVSVRLSRLFDHEIDSQGSYKLTKGIPLSWVFQRTLYRWAEIAHDLRQSREGDCQARHFLKKYGVAHTGRHMEQTASHRVRLWRGGCASNSSTPSRTP